MGGNESFAAAAVRWSQATANMTMADNSAGKTFSLNFRMILEDTLCLLKGREIGFLRLFKPGKNKLARNADD
jgi:hypothetical protein